MQYFAIQGMQNIMLYFSSKLNEPRKQFLPGLPRTDLVNNSGLLLLHKTDKQYVLRERYKNFQKM
jgi:hypothetical protein